MNHFLNRVAGGDSTDPARLVAAIEQAITNARTYERVQVEVREGVTSDLTAYDARVAETRQETARDREERRDLVEAIKHLDLGVPSSIGVLPVLSQFVNKPGLIETRRCIAQLEEELKGWKLLRDDTTARPYRLKPGLRHVVDGRRVLPGEIVHLTPTAFRAFGDKFQAVDAEEVSATT